MQKKDMSVTDTVAAEHFQEMESTVDQVSTYKEVETFDDNKLDIDWRDNDNIGVQYVNHGKELLDILAELQQIWAVRSRQIDMVRHHIEVATLHAFPMKFAPYCTRPKTLEFEKLKSTKWST